MITGFNLWQKRVAIIGLLGVLVSIVGIFFSTWQVASAGVLVTLASVLGLVLLGNRQNWRQIKGIQRNLDRPVFLDSSPARGNRLGLPKVGSDYEYASRIRRSRGQYESFALQNKSLEFRNPFALAATNDLLNFRDLMRFIQVAELGMLPELSRPRMAIWDASALCALARLQANQRATESDLDNSVAIYRFVEKFFGTRNLNKTDRFLYAESLGELGQFQKQKEIMRRLGVSKANPTHAALVELNSLEKSTMEQAGTWLAELNKLFQDHGYAPVYFQEQENLSLLDRLSTAVQPEHGPKVSVIIPSFQGGKLLLTSVRSMLNQSWDNLEIIVVDDGSGSEYEEYLRQAEALSDKVKVVRQSVNMGAYCARNAGLEVATGEFITVHDDDDWSHGDKIAVQVKHLMKNPQVVGNMSLHSRATDDLKFLRINNNPRFSQPNFSSLMVRKSLFDEIGPWDAVNRGADSEFRDRIVRYTGERVEVVGDVPLSFTRTWDGSLTAQEMARGYVDPARQLYLAGYQSWFATAGADPALLRPQTSRRFPIPSNMRPGKRNEHLGRFDVVFATDFRFPGGTSSLTLNEINLATQQGLRVGYMQIASPLASSADALHFRLFELQLDGVVEQIGLADRAEIDLLVVRHPSVLAYADGLSSNLTVGETVLIVNNPPVLTGGTGMVFDIPQALENADRIFRTTSTVVAESGVTRRLCESLTPSGRLSPLTWPGVISMGKRKDPDFSGKPVLGRHSRDHQLKWPTTRRDFDAVYTSEDYDTIFLGGADSLVKKLGEEVLEGKVVHSFGSMEPADFLDDVDFWAYFHDDALTESFGMSIAEAMAAGKVVILPHYLRASFGAGAVYAEPEQVPAIIQDYWANPEKYLAQSDAAQEFVRVNFSVEKLIERIGLLSKPSSNVTAERTF